MYLYSCSKRSKDFCNTAGLSSHLNISTGKGSCVQDGLCEQTNLGQQKCFPLQRTHSFLYRRGWLRIWMLFAWSLQVRFHLLRRSRIVLRCLAWWYWWIWLFVAGLLWSPRAFLQMLVLGASTVSVFYCIGGRTAEHALGFVYLSPILKWSRWASSLWSAGGTACVSSGIMKTLLHMY